MEDIESKVAHQSVIKPPGEWRNFRAISLPNQLKVLLISDKQATKAAAALGVHAGSMLDPPDLEGLSHLCQHMLLSGSSKSGEEESFEELLNEHGGEYNGSTHRDVVIHGFQIAPNLLTMMLTHFSQFITHPSFPSGRLIEAIKKIQIEYENRAVNDEEREWRVISSVVDVTHPYSRFDCGNRYTLWDRPIEKKVNILEQLKGFHAQHYSANLMSLVVLGRESLEELETLTTSLFSEIFNANLPHPSWPSSPLTDNELPVCVEMVPLIDKRHMQLVFPVPDCTECFKNGAVPYIRYVLSYEGPGSLVTTLKLLHLIRKAGVDYDQPASGFAFITIQFELTREGVERSNDVITTFFQYVKMLRKQGPQKNIWKELRTVNETRFMFSKIETELIFVENLVTLLPLVPTQEVLSCRYLFTEYNPEVIRYLMDCIVPHRMLSVTSWNGFGPIADQVEKWYGTLYKQSRFGESVLQRWYACPPASNLSHPPPNPFVATEFYLKSKEPDSDVTPIVLDEDEFSRVWYFQDDRFAEPQASIILHIMSPLPRECPTHYALTKFMAKIISEGFLTEFASSAHEAGLWYSLEASNRGLTVTTHGYNHKLHLLFNYILNRLFHFLSFGNVGPNFDNIRNDYIQELQNSLGQEPSVCATELVEQLMTQDCWTSETIIHEISKLHAPSMLTAYAARFFSFVRLHWLFHGNYSKKEAMNIYRTSMEYFRCVHCKPLPISKIGSPPPTKFPTGTTTINRIRADSAESDAVKVIQAGNQPPTPRDVALLEMIEHLLYDPATEFLRGIGSYLWTNVKRTNDKLVLIILVQSIDDPVAMQQKIDGFLLTTSTMILDMRRWEFLDHRLSFGLHKADIQPKSLWAASSEVFQEIFNETYNFDRSKKEIMAIQSIEYAEMKRFFDDWIDPRSSNKRCYCINTLGTGPPRNQTLTVPFAKHGSWHNPILEQSDVRPKLNRISSAIPENTKLPDSAEDTTATEQELNFQPTSVTKGSTSSCARGHSRSKGPSLNVSRKHSRTSSSKSKHSFRPLSRGKLASSLSQTKFESMLQSEVGGSSDADSQNMQRYYIEVEEELEKLTHIKMHLMSTIQKTKPQSGRTEDTKWNVSESEAESVFERAKLHAVDSPMSPIHGEGFPEVEYQVYTLPSSLPENQEDRKGTSSRRSLRSREQDAGDNKNEILRVLPSSLKPGGKYYNSLQPTLSRIMKRIERTKGAATKTIEANEQARESKKMVVNAESKKSVKSDRRKSSKGNSKASLSAGSPRTTKVFPAVSKNEQVAEIEELDFDIQEEISRLQKIRKLLDAKAKRILRKEEEKVNNNNNMSFNQLATQSDKKLAEDSQDSEQVVFPGNVMDAKLARKVEMTVLKAKKVLEEDINKNKNPDGLSLEDLEKQISAAQREDRATAVFNMLHQLDTKAVENTFSNRPRDNPDENPVTSNRVANPFEVKKFEPSRKDSEDGSFRHQDLIQWLQGMFPDREIDRRGEPQLDGHERRTSAETPRNQQRTSMGSSLSQSKTNDTEAEQATPKLQMSKLPVLTESELKMSSDSPLKSDEATLKKPKVFRKVVEPPPQTSTPSVSANPSTAKPISRNMMKSQQVITQNGISPKFPLKIHQPGKPPFNLSTKVSGSAPPKKLSKTLNKNMRKPGTPKNSSFPLRPIRKRSDSNTSSPRKTSEAGKIDQEKPTSGEAISNMMPTHAVSETKEKDSYREVAADSKLETTSMKRETKRALSDAKLIKMKHRSEIMRPTSSERDVVDRKSHQISDSVRQLSLIGTSDNESRVSRSPRRNSSMMKPSRSRRSRSRRSSSTITSKLLRKRSNKDVSQSKRKSRKDKKNDIQAKNWTTRRHGGYHVSSSDDADRRRWESDSQEDNTSHKSTSRKSVVSRKGIKSARKPKRPKKLRESCSKESEISGFQSPPSPISLLGNKQRLKISEYDVLAADQRLQQTWETLKVTGSESVTRRSGQHGSPISGKMPELKFQRSYPRRSDPTKGSKVNISEHISSDLKNLNESIRDLPLKGLHLPSNKLSKTRQ